MNKPVCSANSLTVHFVILLVISLQANEPEVLHIHWKRLTFTLRNKMDK